MNPKENLTPEKIYQSTIEETFEKVKKEAAGEITYGFTNDYMFRAVFQKNIRALKGLLCAVLNLEPEEILSCEITNPIVLGESIGDKTCILDIRIRLNGDQRLNMEMQVGNLGNWPKRSVYYLCTMFTDLKKGQDYNDALPCVHIGFVSRSPFADYHEFVSRYLLMNPDNGHLYSRDLSLIMVDLSLADQFLPELADSHEPDCPVPDGLVSGRETGEISQVYPVSDKKYYKDKNKKVRKNDNQELRQWARLLRADSWEEAMTLATKSETMKEAVVTLRELSEEDKIKLQCEARMYYQGDMRSAREQGIKIGVGQGIEIGLGQGLKKGVNLINSLTQRLIADNRLEDLARSAADQEYQQRLLKEYGLLEADAEQ